MVKFEITRKEFEFDRWIDDEDDDYDDVVEYPEILQKFLNDE